MDARIRPSIISGTVPAPQSKSLAIRLLFSSLVGKVKITDLEISEDVRAALDAMKSIGVESNGDSWEFHENSYSPPGTINFGSSGTTLRMMIPVLSFLGADTEIDGSEGLRKRPIGLMTRWLREQGMSVSGDSLPFKLKGRIDGSDLKISGSESSQYISGLIFALLIRGGGNIEVVPPVRSSGYIHMTCNLLNRLGAKIEFSGNVVKVNPLDQKLNFAGMVPGDFLLASFYGIAAALTGGKVRIANLERIGAQDADARIVETLARCGAASFLEDGIWNVSAAAPLRSFRENILDSPDMAVSLAAIAAGASGISSILGTDLLETKESNRIESIIGTLNNFGVEAWSNGKLSIRGTRDLKEGLVEDWQDHRITMLGSVLALSSGGIAINCDSVRKSNPRFYEDLIKLGGMIQFS